MSEGYKVVPEALRQTQVAFLEASGGWKNFADNNLARWKLEGGSLGLLGRMSGIINDYNAAIETIRGRTTQGIQTFDAASAALNKVASTYEAQDEEYYKKFGWIGKDLDAPAPPPQS